VPVQSLISFGTPDSQETIWQSSSYGIRWLISCRGAAQVADEFRLSVETSVMTTATQQRRIPLGLFPDRVSPRLYDRIIEVLRVRHYRRRT
jgi:hypothetical protein